MRHELTAEQKNWLVEKAEKLADKVGRMRNQASQLRNMLQIAGEESEISVLVNFVNYQAARQSTYRFWTPIHNELVKTLKEIGERHRDQAERQIAIQQFFGFMIRRYVYLEPKRQGGK